MMDLGKKAQINLSGKLTSIVVVIITVVVLFQIFASLVPEAQSAGTELSDATRCADAGRFFNVSQTACLTNSSLEGIVVSFDAIPISSIFSSSGVVILLLMVSLFVGVIQLVMPKGKK